MRKLKTCPCCGGEADTNVINQSGRTKHFLSCMHVGCGLEGPVRDSLNQAIVAWNTRTADRLTGEYDIDNVIDVFVDCVSGLELEDLIKWADFLDMSIDTDYPPTDDQYPDWEAELRTEVGEAMGRAFDKE